MCHADGYQRDGAILLQRHEVTRALRRDELIVLEHVEHQHLTSSSSGTSSLRLHCERYTQFLGSALSQYDNEVNLLLMKMFADASRCRAELCEAV